MATTKKTSTKAKTKTTSAKASTTKKTTTKSAKPAAASAAKSPAKVVSKATPAKPSRASKGINMTLQKLRSLHFISMGVFALLAVAAASLMESVSHQLTIGHLAKDQLASTSETVLAPALQSVYDVEVRWLLVAVLALSVVLPLLYVTRLQGKYEQYLDKTRMLPLRWIDYAVTGALMTEIVALLSGVSDLPTLKLIAGMVVVTAVLGLISERQNNTTVRPVKSAYYASLFAGVLPWLFIASYAVATVVYGAVRSPWYVYALYAVVLGGFALMARNQRMSARGANYLIVERNYIVISMLTKALFAVVLIAGLYR